MVAGLGQGGYACVVECEALEPPSPPPPPNGGGQRQPAGRFALKVVPKHKAARRRERARLAVELSVMTEVPPSPFLQRCHLAFESATDLFFVVDLASGGDLFFHLVARIQATGGGFAEDEARTLLAEVVLALTHLHAHGFVHRDVKVENVMLDARGHVKLVDFGLACALAAGAEEGPMSPTGSLIYMAPEMLRDSTGGRHTDWWAVGVLAHELLTGRTPWSSLTDKKVIRQEIKTMHVAPPLRLTPPAGALICSLLRQDYRRRLGSAGDHELRAAKFFAPVDWATLASGEAAPAIVPGPNCVADRDRAAALGAYRSRAEAHRRHAGLLAKDAGDGGPAGGAGTSGSTASASSGSISGGSSGELAVSPPAGTPLALAAAAGGGKDAVAPWWLGLPFVEHHPEVVA